MTTEPRLLLLVERDSGFFEAARDLFPDHPIVTAGDLDEATEIVRSGRVDLVLLGPAFSSDAQITSAGALVEADPGVSVVLVAHIVTNRILRSAMRAGFADVVDAPLTTGTAVELLSRVPETGPREVRVVVEHVASSQSEEEEGGTVTGPAPVPSVSAAGETEEGPQTSFETAPAAARPASQPSVSDAEHGWEDVADDEVSVESALALERLIPVLPAPADDDRATRPVAPEQPRRRTGQVIAVMTGKGGSGKTVVATNLAIALGLRRDPEQVVILDGDLQFGDVALMLQIDPVRTIDDVAGRSDDMSDAQLDAALVRHESGIRALPAPLLPVGADEITSKDVVAIIERLRTMYEIVIVDTGPVFDDGLITILEHADDVVIVVDMDLASVKNAKVILNGLRSTGFPMERMTMVVNRINSRVGLDLIELERSLRLRVGGSVPSDRLVPMSVNEGIPATLLRPRSRVARAFHALAETLDPEARRERLTAG